MTEVEALGALLADLIHPDALAGLAVIGVCLLLAWAMSAALRPRDAEPGIWLGERGFDGLLFPLLALGLALAARGALHGQLQATAVFKLAVPMLVSLAVIRVGVRVLQVAFPASTLVRALARSLSWGVWMLTVLWITELLPAALDAMEAITWKIGGSPVTLRSLLEGALTAAAVLVAMLWLSATIERRLMRASSVHLSVRKIAANGTRAGLLLVGLLLALSSAGIPLAALSVLGGAVGVGLGFGLQKLAANYVSGFVILAERSLRIGDVVKVDGFEGRITDITTRYTVVRAVNGRESIVPNELLITQRVENCSFADPRVALTTVVQVAYDTALDPLMPQLVAAAMAVPRVLADPAPGVQLSAFAADGLELTLVFWIGDMENGQGNVRSDVNLALLRALNQAGVQIPFPQRMMHVKVTMPEPVPALGALLKTPDLAAAVRAAPAVEDPVKSP